MKKQSALPFGIGWGGALMGLLAASPIIAHSLDWKKRTEAKQRVADEKALQRKAQIARATSIVPEGDAVYKAAAFFRKMSQAPGRAPEEKLDTIQIALKGAKRKASQKAVRGVKGTPTLKFRGE